MQSIRRPFRCTPTCTIVVQLHSSCEVKQGVKLNQHKPLSANSYPSFFAAVVLFQNFDLSRKATVQDFGTKDSISTRHGPKPLSTLMQCRIRNSHPKPVLTLMQCRIKIVKVLHHAFHTCAMNLPEYLYLCIHSHTTLKNMCKV